MSIIYGRNDALDINPPAGDTHLSVGGSDWLWAASAIYLFSFLTVFAHSFKARAGEKIFHYIFIVALFAGGIAYYAMASDLAFAAVTTQLNRGDATSYQVFFAKYINWVVAFPSVILVLGLISGISWATIFFNIFLCWVWIVGYLCSAFTTTSYKWGFYVFGTIAYLFLVIQILWTGRASAARLSLSRDYSLIAGWVNLLWILYPIAFACADGGNVIGATQSLIWFGILDVLMVPCISFAVIVLSRRWDYGALNLHFTQYGRVNAGEGVHPEKPTATPATTEPAV